MSSIKSAKSLLIDLSHTLTTKLFCGAAVCHKHYSHARPHVSGSNGDAGITKV